MPGKSIFFMDFDGFSLDKLLLQVVMYRVFPLMFNK